MTGSLNPIFTVRETHGRVLRRKPLNRHSPDIGWRSLYTAILEEAPFQATEPAIHHPSLIYHLSRPTEVMRRIEGAAQDHALIGPRRICLTPGQAIYPTGTSPDPEQVRRLSLKRHSTLPAWNYTIAPM